MDLDIFYLFQSITVKIVLYLASENVIRLDLDSFQYDPSSILWFPCFPICEDIYTFHALDLEPAISSRTSGSFQWVMIFREHNRDARGAYFYLISHCFGAF